MRWLTSKRVFLIVVAIIVALLVAFGIYFEAAGRSLPQASVELGIASFSPSGAAGGAVIPASCGSPHAGDMCEPPTVTVTPLPGDGTGGGSNATVNAGGGATITWSAPAGATSCATDFSSGSALTGSVVVHPSDTTTYTVICDTPGDDAPASVTVTVIHPLIHISANPTRVRPSTATLLTWTSASVITNSCHVTAPDGFIKTADSGTDVPSNPLTVETIFTLTCRTAAGPVSDSVTVTMQPTFIPF